MKQLIQVCGDPTVDWFRIHNENIVVRGGVYFWRKQQEISRVRMSSKGGGAASVLQLLQEIIPGESAVIEGLFLDEELLQRPKDDRITTSWTLWREFDNPGFDRAFRLSEWQEFEPGCWDYESHRLTGSPNLLVIQDSGLGFRTSRDGWPEALSGLADRLPEHIIFRLGQYGDIPDNPLLDRIEELGLSDCTTIVTSLSDLRSCPVKVGISLSWERMLEEVVAAVRSSNCPFWNENSHSLKYKRVIVTIGASGAVMVGNEVNSLVFDCRGQEGDFAAKYPGQMIGYNTCVIAALAAEWTRNPAFPDWQQGVYQGMALARLLHVKGFDVVEEGNYQYLQYPYAMLARAYRELNDGTKQAEVWPAASNIGDLGIFSDYKGLAANPRRLGKWTILENTLLKEATPRDYLENTRNIEAVGECARNIVVYGPRTALPDVPIEIVGSWCSADRQEVEGVRSVNNAMKSYLQLQKPETPLGVAVFGPPGAGKSFVIKEIAKGLGIDTDAQLTFNLSQFQVAAELQNAFHQIRDLNLKGKTPLVFWDEFDTPCEGQPLGWLQYFLAPMQDGEFTDQGRTHPLGRGIYVFAGATRPSFEDFRADRGPKDRDAKKPDFTSRLRAYINIKGINGDPNTVEDRLYMIRRAFVLRQYLETAAPQIRSDEHIEIETGVLDAFLRISQYLHGARSMDNLVKMSSLHDKRKYELSSLPPDHILKMHVNMEEFNALTRLGHREMLRIGISGHINLDLNQMPKLQQAVQRAIDFIEQQFPERYLTVFSPLAIGADRLVARELLKKDNSRLIAVLPVPRDEYINDFGLTDDYWVDKQGAELRKEFKYWLSERATEIINISPLPSRKEAYLKAGYFIAEHSDVMIVVWDGQSNLDSSVTAQIVDRAERLHKPICHIWARNNKLDSSWTDGVDKHGQVRYKRFSCTESGDWLEI